MTKAKHRGAQLSLLPGAELPPPVAVKALADGAVELVIYGEIGEWNGETMVTASGIAGLLKAQGDVGLINVRLNSPGGNAFEAAAIHNVLTRHPARVEVDVDGLALSAASIVAMAGDEIRMAGNALMMIHQAWALAVGTVDDLRARAEMLDRVDVSIAATYAARTGKDVDEIVELMAAETWMTAEEAVEAGFADSVTNTMAVAASLLPEHLERFRNVPEALMALAKAVPYKAHTPKNTGSWDGAGAKRRLRAWATDGDDVDWAKYRQGFAWYEAEDAEVVASYKLPHHDIDGGAVITSRAGVIAAGNALMGGRGGVDIPAGDVAAVRSHLGRHYKQFDLEPPWEANDSGATASAKRPATATNPREDDDMPKQIAKALNLHEDADEVAVVAAIGALSTRAALASEVEAVVGKQGAEAIGAVRAMVQAATERDELAVKLAKVEGDQQRDVFAVLLKGAQEGEEKKLTPAMAAHWQEQFDAAEDKPQMSAQLKGYLDVAAPVLPKNIDQPEGSTGSATITNNGKGWSDMKPAVRAALKRENPDLYNTMREAAVRQGLVV